MTEIDELRRSIHRKLSVGPLTAGEISEALSIDIGEVGRCLRIMERDNCVAHVVMMGGLIKWRII